MRRFFILLFAFIGFCLWTGTVQAGIDDDLIAYYPFDGDIEDDSGNGNNGDEIGTISYVDGKSGQAASFDGSSGIDIGDIDLSSPFTISLWFKADDVSTSGECIINKSGPGNTDNYGITIKSGQIAAGIKDDTEISNNTYEKAQIYYDVNSEQWYHCAAQWDGSYYNLYIDGELVGQEDAAFDALVTNNYDTQIGSRYNTTSQRFNGLIDEVRIYDRAISESEIQELYDGTSGDDSVDLNFLVKTSESAILTEASPQLC